MKKGQISIFIILGIIFFVFMGFVVYHNNVSKKEILEQNKYGAEDIAEQKERMKDFVSECIRMQVIEGIDAYGLCESDETDERIARHIDLDLTRCADLSGFLGLNIDTEIASAAVEINPDSVTAEVEYPVYLDNTLQKTTFDMMKIIIERTSGAELELDEDGRTLEEIKIFTGDEDLELMIPKGVKVIGGDKISIKIKEICNGYPDHDDPMVVGKIKYEFLPENIEFLPNDDGELPRLLISFEDYDVGSRMTDIFIGKDEHDGKGWIVLDESVVNGNALECEIKDFCDYAVLQEAKTGIQVMVQDGVNIEDDEMIEEFIDGHVDCASKLSGDSGYVKSLVYANTMDYVKQFVESAWEHKQIPVLSLKPSSEFIPRDADDEISSWPHPGECDTDKCDELDCSFGTTDARWDYEGIAQEFADLIEHVHPIDQCEKPLIVEVWNEPNLDYEWGGVGITEEQVFEYVMFLHETISAIREVDESENLFIMNAGLSPQTEDSGVCRVKPDRLKKEALGEADDLYDCNDFGGSKDKCEPDLPHRDDYKEDHDDNPDTPKIVNEEKYLEAKEKYLKDVYGSVISDEEIAKIKKDCYMKTTMMAHDKYIKIMYDTDDALSSTDFSDDEKAMIGTAIEELPDMIDIWASHVYADPVKYNDELDLVPYEDVFLTEAGLPQPASNSDAIISAMEGWDADDRVVGYTFFELYDPGPDWGEWNYAEKVCVDVCIGTGVYDAIAGIEDGQEDCEREVADIANLPEDVMQEELEWDSSYPDMKWDIRLSQMGVVYEPFEAEDEDEEYWTLVKARYQAIDEEDDTLPIQKPYIFVNFLNADNSIDLEQELEVLLNGEHMEVDYHGTITDEWCAHNPIEEIFVCHVPIKPYSKVYDVMARDAESDVVRGIYLPYNNHANFIFEFKKK